MNVQWLFHKKALEELTEAHYFKHSHHAWKDVHDYWERRRRQGKFRKLKNLSCKSYGEKQARRKKERWGKHVCIANLAGGFALALHRAVSMLERSRSHRSCELG